MENPEVRDTKTPEDIASVMSARIDNPSLRARPRPFAYVGASSGAFCAYYLFESVPMLHDAGLVVFTPIPILLAVGCLMNSWSSHWRMWSGRAPTRFAWLLLLSGLALSALLVAYLLRE